MTAKQKTSGKDSNMLNRVLIERLPFRKYKTRDGNIGLCVDGSALPFIVEELIACAAGEICVMEQSHVVEFVKTLVPAFQNNIKIVNGSPSFKRSRAFIDPILNEFHLKASNDFSRIQTSKIEDKNTVDAAVNLVLYINKLIIGIDNKLQLDLDFSRFQDSVTHLRSVAHEPECRARLSIIDGVLSSYKSFQSEFLLYRPTNDHNIAELFFEIVHDDYYRQLSKSVWNYGFTDLCKEAFETVRRHVRDLVNHSKYCEVFNLGTRSVTVATDAPMPDSDAVSKLFGRGYLPPVIQLDSIIEKAHEIWKIANPDPRPPKMLDEKFRDAEFD